MIHHFDTVAFNSNLLVSAAKLLEIPVLATEQYSRAFGHTVPEIQLDDVPVFEKRKFSMLTEEVSEHFASLGDKKTVVLFGIESHVCVLQTCLELLDQGTEVHLVYDAVSSQRFVSDSSRFHCCLYRRFEREMAIERMTKAGAFVNSTEGIVFQLMGLCYLKFSFSFLRSFFLFFRRLHTSSIQGDFFLVQRTT